MERVNHWSRKVAPATDGPLTQADREYLDLKFRDGGHVSTAMIRKLIRLHDEQAAIIRDMQASYGR